MLNTITGNFVPKTSVAKVLIILPRKVWTELDSMGSLGFYKPTKEVFDYAKRFPEDAPAYGKAIPIYGRLFSNVSPTYEHINNMLQELIQDAGFEGTVEDWEENYSLYELLLEPDDFTMSISNLGGCANRCWTTFVRKAHILSCYGIKRSFDNNPEYPLLTMKYWNESLGEPIRDEDTANLQEEARHALTTENMTRITRPGKCLLCEKETYYTDAYGKYFCSNKCANEHASRWANLCVGSGIGATQYWNVYNGNKYIKFPFSALSLLHRSFPSTRK